MSDDVHSPTNAGPDPADKGPTFEVEGDKGPTFEPPVAGSEAPAGAGMLGTGPQPGPSAAGQHPEVLVGAALAGGFLAALIIKRLGD
ncbi:MAG TPA: hypothetical protein VIL64_00490 [Solirubrobacteraceae bacterium]